MSPSLSPYNIGNDFVSRDVLLELLEGHKDEDGTGPYVFLYLTRQSRVFEGRLVDVKGGTALLKTGTTLQFVDIDQVVAIGLRARA